MSVLAAEAARSFHVEPHLGLVAPAGGLAEDLDEAFGEFAVLKDMIEQRTPGLRISSAGIFGDLTDSARTDISAHSVTKDMRPNVLITPDANLGNILIDLIRTVSEGAVMVGPVLLGDRSRIQVAKPSSTVIDIVELAVLAVGI